MNRQSQSNFTESLNEDRKSDISVHKVNISILELWGTGSRKRKKTPQQLTRPTFNLAELLRSNQSQNSLPWKKTRD